MDRNSKAFCSFSTHFVALRKESVDRNRDNEMALQEGMKVALRKESVDRNRACESGFIASGVALRKESVDRNRNFETC